MKHLIDYLNEALQAAAQVIAEGAVSSDEIIKKLASNRDLSGYVDVLNAMLGDDDAKNILTSAFKNSDDPDAIEFDGEFKAIAVKNLHPTQSEIDVDKSIGYPFKGVKEAESNMKQFFENANEVKMPFPLVTFAGQFILDGHHRWSQVYSFNPQASMQCFDLTVKGGTKVSPQDALKICQGLLAVKRAEDGKGKLPKSVVEGVNLFKMNDDDVKSKVLEYCGKDAKVTEIIREACGKDSDDKLASYLTANLADLRKNNLKYAESGNGRGVMPQTDKGGDNPDKGMDATAAPDKEGSALHTMANNAKVDPDVLPKK